MGNAQCTWVRDRLPLLAGNDLLGSERRRVERHLIGCPHCRGRKEALESAFEVLQAAAAESPVNRNAPSLWPALARQIRESRRPVPSAGLAWLFAWSRLRPLPTFGLAVVLFIAIGLTLSVRHQLSASRAAIAQASQPTEIPDAGQSMSVEQPTQVRMARQDHAENALDPAPAPRFDYDLEHGTPMGPDTPLETKSKLTH